MAKPLPKEKSTIMSIGRAESASSDASREADEVLWPTQQ